MRISFVARLGFRPPTLLYCPDAMEDKPESDLRRLGFIEPCLPTIAFSGALGVMLGCMRLNNTTGCRLFRVRQVREERVSHIHRRPWCRLDRTISWLYPGPESRKRVPNPA